MGDRVLTAVRTIVDAKRARVGDDIVRLAGPGGEWRVRYECRAGTGAWDLKVYPPRTPEGKVRRPLASVRAVERALGRDAVHLAELDELDALVDAVFAHPDALARELLASLAIQQAWRAWRLRRARAALGAAFRATCAARAAAIARHPHVHAPVTVHLRTPPAARTEAEVLERQLRPAPAAATEALARAVLADPWARAGPRACAAAYVGDPIALLGHLPTPRGARRHAGIYLAPNPAGAPSAAHAALLGSCFLPPWAAVVAAELADPALGAAAYDAYLDRARTRLAGSVAVQRLLVEHAGARVPVVVVLSIAAHARKCGYGTALFDLACELLFVDLPPSMARGYVVAECLELRFWAHRLEHEALGRALGHVLAAHFPAHHLLRDECTMRATAVERAAPMAA